MRHKHILSFDALDKKAIPGIIIEASPTIVDIEAIDNPPPTDPTSPEKSFMEYIFEQQNNTPIAVIGTEYGPVDVAPDYPPGGEPE